MLLLLTAFLRSELKCFQPHSGTQVFAHLPHFVPIYQFGQITLRRPFWCRGMVLLRASRASSLSQAVKANPLPQSKAVDHCVVFFVLSDFLLLVPGHLQDKKMGLPP